MPRITPSSGSAIDLTELVDDEAYKCALVKPKDGWYSEGSAQYGSEQRLTVDWQLEDGVTSVRDWIGLRLGKQQNGTVSKLRMLLNALAEKPRDTEVKMFVSETLEWGYDEPQFDKAGKYLNPYAQVSEGMEVMLRGQHGTKQDGSDKFTIQKYGSVTAKAKPAARKLGKQTTDDSEPPF